MSVILRTVFQNYQHFHFILYMMEKKVLFGLESFLNSAKKNPKWKNKNKNKKLGLATVWAVKSHCSGALVGRKCLEEGPFTWNFIGTEKITSKEEKKDRRGRGFVFPGGFPHSLAVKNLPVMQETPVLSLGWENPLEESMATHSSILARRIPLDSGSWWVTVHGVAKSRKRLSN